MYNFNEAVDRHNTKSVKYEEMDLNFGTKDLMPFWIADMEIKAPDFMIDALVKRARHGVFGYTKRMPDYYAAVGHWLKTRHGLEARPEHIEYAPGVVFALNMMIRMFTSPGDKIIIQTPVYYPFFNIIRGNGRVISENPLILESERYRMDFADLREKVRDERCKMLILCSPHNPVGRVWTEAELRELGEICLANHVLVVSDEIHFDIVLKGHKHIPFASLSENFRQHSVTCTAPSKTFNIAGLHSAYVLMYDPAKMERYKKELSLLDLNRSNVFSQEVTQVAYEQGAAWVDELLEHIEGNMDYVYGFISQNIPGIKPFKMEGTYLMWLDCRQLAPNATEIEQLFIGKAGLALDGGHWFGEPGKGFMRINLACPRAMLEQAMQKLLVLKK